MKYFDGFGKEVTDHVVNLHQENEHLKREVDELATATVSKLRKKNKALKAEITAKDEQIVELTETNHVLEVEIMDLKDELKTSKQSHSTLILEKKTLEKEVKELKKPPLGKVIEIR